MKNILFTLMLVAVFSVSLFAQNSKADEFLLKSRQNCSEFAKEHFKTNAKSTREVATNYSIIFYQEDFEGTFNWTTIDVDTDGKNWNNTCDNTFDIFPHSGSCHIISASFDGDRLYPENYIVSPQIDLTAVTATAFVDWWVRPTNAYWCDEEYFVVVSNSGTDIGDFTDTIFHETLTSFTEYENRLADLSAYAGQSIHLAFIHLNDETHIASADNISIDDVTIFQPIDYDVAVMEIISPIDTNCIMSATENITVLLQNLGNLEIQNFPISYNLNGTIVTETITDAIQPFEEYEYTFSNIVDLSADGEYNLSVYTALTDDADNLNDTVEDVFISNNSNIHISITEIPYPYFLDKTWYITNELTEEVVAQGGVPTEGLELDVCVSESGCYLFTLHAAVGEGLVYYDENDNELEASYTIEYNNQFVGGDSGRFGYLSQVWGMGTGCPVNEIEMYSVNMQEFNLDGEIPIEGTVFNYGTDTITSFQVYYTINGTDVSLVHTVTDVNIPIGEFYTFAHEIPYNFDTNGDYTITMNVVNVNGVDDEDMSNNEASTEIVVSNNLTQRRVLIEAGSQVSGVNCAENDLHIHDLVLANPDKVTPVIYHYNNTSFNDPFYLFSDAMTMNIMRIHKYDHQGHVMMDVAFSVLDGFKKDELITQEEIDERCSYPSPFSINGNFTLDGNTLTVEGNVEALVDNNDTLSLYLLLLEDKIAYDAENGMTEFNHIFRKMLPDWGLAVYAMPEGHQFTFNETYNISGTINKNKIKVIGFLQRGSYNLEIMQSAILPNSVQSDIDDMNNSDISIYPNPSKGLIYIDNAENSEISIYNICGQKVLHVFNDKYNSEIDLNSLPQGSYFVKVVKNDEVITRQIILNN